MVLCCPATKLRILVQFYPFLFAHFIIIIHNKAADDARLGWGQRPLLLHFYSPSLHLVHFLARVIRNSSTKQLPAALQIFCNEGKGSFSQLPQGCNTAHAQKNWLYVHVILSSSQKKSHYGPGPPRTVTGWVWNKSKHNVTSKLEKKMKL